MSPLVEALKNEHTKRILYVTGVRRPSLTQRETPHYRMPKLQANGGYLRLKKYDGPEIPPRGVREPHVHHVLLRRRHHLRADHLLHRGDRAQGL